LPAQWCDAGVVQDLYGYDANANVVSITDQQEGLSSRSMGYDGLDRLTAANGIWARAASATTRWTTFAHEHGRRSQ
jgi:hypothetical protein